MDLKEYFENNEGFGVLSTADEEGRVDSAVYAKPHITANNLAAGGWKQLTFPGQMANIGSEVDAPLTGRIRRNRIMPKGLLNGLWNC